MSRKEKLLQSAQKNLKKKQVSKAIKDYQKLVELEPQDVRCRQKLGELLSRSNRTEEALEQYEAVAKYYVENDFQVKAIAIFKQIQRLDPDHVQSYMRLAELNEKQGLVGNALSEYQALVSFHEKRNEQEEAVNVLKKMRDLDGSNLNVRAKLVETCARLGRSDEAVDEFQGISEVLKQKKAYDKILKLYEMFLPILPEVPAMQKGLASILIDKGEVDKGIRLVQDLLKQQPNDAELLTVLAHGYTTQGNHKSARMTYQQLVQLQPKDLDLRQALIQSCLADHQFTMALDDLEEWKDSFLQAERLTELKTFYEQLREQMPDDRRILQTLDSIYALTGDGDKLLDIMQPDAVAPSDMGEVVEDLLGDDDLLSTFDDDVQEDLEGDFLVAGVGEDIPEELDESDFLAIDDDEEISFDDLSDDAFATETAATDAPTEEDFFDLELELETNDSAPSDVSETGTEELVLDDVAAPAPAAEAAEVMLTSDAQSDDVFEFDDAELELEPLELEDEIVELELGDVVTDAPTTIQVAEDPATTLEEVDFFLQQGLTAEAEQLCRTFLEKSPDSAEIQNKLQQIRQDILASNSEPVEPVSPPEATAAADENVSLFDDLMAELEDEEVQEDTVAEEEDESATGNVRLGEKLDKNDVDSHYNLGIAYKEMGLLDDAIAEFRKILFDPERFVASHTLLGVCLAEKGQFDDAEKALKKGLEHVDLTDSQRYSLHYELGLLFEKMDQPLNALDSYQYVSDFDPLFRDVKSKVTALRDQLGMDAQEAVGKDRVSYL